VIAIDAEFARLAIARQQQAAVLSSNASHQATPGMPSTAPHRHGPNVSGAPNQWLAWYETDFPTWNDGATRFSDTFTVPAMPAKAGMNIALFPGLQPTYAVSGNAIPWNEPVCIESYGVWQAWRGQGIPEGFVASSSSACVSDYHIAHLTELLLMHQLQSR